MRKPKQSRPPKPSLSASQAPTPFPYVVRMENMTVGTWLQQIAATRPQFPIEDRLEALLWSWPIHRAITSTSPNPLWTRHWDDEETLERQAVVLSRIDGLEGGWYPYESPPKIHDVDFNKTCGEICDRLRDLPDLTIPDPGDDRLWLAMLLEARWGDGERDYRRYSQEKVVARLPEHTQRRVCEIGERARDAAYLSVRIARLLDELRRTKATVKSCIDWLRNAGDYEEFVKERITYRSEHDRGSTEWLFHEDLAALSAAFRVIMARRKRVTEYLHHAFDHLRKDEGRDKRTQAGRPPRNAWVRPAADELTHLKIAAKAPRDRMLRPQERQDLLRAWGLVPMERD